MTKQAGQREPHVTYAILLGASKQLAHMPSICGLAVECRLCGRSGAAELSDGACVLLGEIFKHKCGESRRG